MKSRMELIDAAAAFEIVDQVCALFHRGAPGKRQDTRHWQLDKLPGRKRERLHDFDDQLTELATETTRCLRAFLSDK